MLSICPTICSMAVAFPLSLDLQKQMFVLGWQEEHMRCPFPQLNILRGGFSEWRQIEQEGIREERDGWGVEGGAGGAAELEEGPVVVVETTLLNLHTTTTRTRPMIMNVSSGFRNRNRMNMAILKVNQTMDKAVRNKEIVIFVSRVFLWLIVCFKATIRRRIICFYSSRDLLSISR